MTNTEFLITAKALSKAKHTMQGQNPTISERDSLEWINHAIAKLGFNDLEMLDKYLHKNRERLYQIRKQS